MSKCRVVVTVPDCPPRVYRGERHGEFSNGTGKWISVMVDGTKTVRWFWHEYVKPENEA